MRVRVYCDGATRVMRVTDVGKLIVVFFFHATFKILLFFCLKNLLGEHRPELTLEESFALHQVKNFIVKIGPPTH